MRKRSKEAIIQNLKDAGCDPGTIDRYMECCACGETQKKNRILANHRQSLLDELHQCQKEIDCLDYLIYQDGRNEF